MNAGRGKRWKQDQEWESEEKDLEKFSQLHTRDAVGLSLKDISDVGLGKGKGKGLGKGKGKGRLGNGKVYWPLKMVKLDGEELEGRVY